MNTLRIETQDFAQCLDQQGFGETGHTDKQRMPAGEQRDECLLDDHVLAENDGRGRLMRALNTVSGSLKSRDDVFVRLRDRAHRPHCSL